MEKWESITVASVGYPGIESINELYCLGYKPHQLQALVPTQKQNDIFAHYCRVQKIDIFPVEKDPDMANIPGSDVLLCIGGLPFLLSSESIIRFRYAINLHTGLTQISRGRWQTSWAIMLNFPYTGYTWHHISEKFDAGKIICQEKISIDPNDTALSLNTKILKSALRNIKKVLNRCSGKCKNQKKLGKYFSKKIPYDGTIDPSWDSETVKKFIRAMYHPPYNPARYKDHLIDSYEKYLDIKNQHN
jgi:hypothetical protein